MPKYLKNILIIPLLFLCFCKIVDATNIQPSILSQHTEDNFPLLPIAFWGKPHPGWQCDAILNNCVYTDLIDNWQSIIYPPILTEPALVTRQTDWQKDVLFSAGSYSELTYDQMLIKRTVLNNVSSLLTAKNDREKALLLRNYTYTIVNVGKSGGSLFPFTYSDFQKILQGTESQYCDGIAFFYSGLLTTFGIPSYIVNLGTEKAYWGIDTSETHVATEVFLAKNWVLQDATFNVQWELYAKPLSVGELQQDFLLNPIGELKKIIEIACGRGSEALNISLFHDLIPQANNNGYREVKSVLDNYYVDYEDMLSNVDSGGYKLFGQNAGAFRIYKTYSQNSPWQYHFIDVERGKQSKDVCMNFYHMYGWSFTKPLSKDWQIKNKGLVIFPYKKEIHIYTNKSNWDYQLLSKEFNLSPGLYRIRVIGNLEKGGMQLALLDDVMDSFIASELFYFGFERGNTHDLFVQLDKPKTVSVLLANYSYERDSSIWKIKKIYIDRADILARCILKK